MKYFVVTSTDANVYFEEFETLKEANLHAWSEFDRQRFNYPYRFRRDYHHIFVATPAGDDDLDIEDNYFDSKTFYLPREESSYNNLRYKVPETVNEYENLDFDVDKGKFSFSVPWNLIRDHYIEEYDTFDVIGEQIIHTFYKYAVQEKIDEVLSFYELD